MRVDYNTYLQSPGWQALRRVALEQARHACRVCGSKARLDVHHRTYERLGGEALADVVVLCRGCHDLFHGHGRINAVEIQRVLDRVVARVERIPDEEWHGDETCSRLYYAEMLKEKCGGVF